MDFQLRSYHSFLFSRNDKVESKFCRKEAVCICTSINMLFALEILDMFSIQLANTCILFNVFRSLKIDRLWICDILEVVSPRTCPISVKVNSSL